MISDLEFSEDDLKPPHTQSKTEVVEENKEETPLTPEEQKFIDENPEDSLDFLRS